MKALQDKTIELLKIFLEICIRNDISYYLVCGSVLGTIKYEGMIPWDDDIDVALLRKDYERFLEVAQRELPDWCFLQNYKSDPGFPHVFSKLRNSNTTFIEKDIAHKRINHGIYIDIFPIDGYPNTFFEEIIFFVQKKIYLWIQYSNLEGSVKLKSRIRNKILRSLGSEKHLTKVQKKLDTLYSKYPPENSEFWCNYSNWQGKLEHASKSHYGNGTWATFEGLKVRIPENYDAYLTQKYGDWRADPPIEKQKSHHKCIICDTERPYTYYWPEKIDEYLK